LRARGIQAMVHYPQPLHMGSIYEDQPSRGSLPVAEQAAREVLSLPVYPGLPWEAVSEVVQAVKTLLGQGRRRSRVAVAGAKS